MGWFRRILAGSAWVVISALPAFALAQVTPDTFNATTPGWVAMSGMSLDPETQFNGRYPGFDPDGPVVKVWDVTQPGGLAAPTVWNLPGFTPTVQVDGGSRYVWTGRSLGQVFGLAVDAHPGGPYLYATETAIYGSWFDATWAHDPQYSSTQSLVCDVETDCYPGLQSLSLSAANTSHPFDRPVQDGFFAFPAPLSTSLPERHGGAVWRLSLRADLSTANDPNRTFELAALIPTSRMSLGQIAHNPDADTFYVSNFADGKIYIFKNPPVGGAPVTSGFATYDHGNLTGIPSSGDGPFTAYGRRVWGVQYNPGEKRLYYAVWNADHRFQRRDTTNTIIPNQIWSVDLDGAGLPIASTVTMRISLPPYPVVLPTNQGTPPSLGAWPGGKLTCDHILATNPGPNHACYSQPVSDIAFNSTGDVMLLAERGERIGRVIGAGYDNTPAGNNILAHNSRILRYRKNPETGVWTRDTASDYGQYSGDGNRDLMPSPAIPNATGGMGTRSDSTGGVDFGYGYHANRNGHNTLLNPAARDAWVWNGTNSGGTLGVAGCGNQINLQCPFVYGLMGAKLATLPGAGATSQITQPAANLYFIDFDGYVELNAKGMGGDVETHRPGNGTLKICKVAGPGVSQGQQFGFLAPSANARPPVTVPAGPGPGGWCKVAGTYPGGTVMTVNESAVAGVSVTDIQVEPASAMVGAPDLAGRTVSVALVPGGVTEVTFTNARPTGFLEICKAGDVTGTYVFSTNGTDRITVPAGACSSAIEVPAGPVKIKEMTPGAVMTGCSTLPANRQLDCSLAYGVSVVTVVPGGISSQTIATITNAKVEERPRSEGKK